MTQQAGHTTKLVKQVYSDFPVMEFSVSLMTS